MTQFVDATSSLPATLALLLWMPLSVAAFALTKPHRAAALLFVYGTLFLPELEYFDIKLLPNMDKKTIVCGWVFFPALLWCSARLKRTNLGRLPWLLFGLMVIVDIGRALTNQDALVVGGRVIPPILLHTALTFMMEDFLLVFVPYFIGAALFNDRESLRDLFRVFCTAGVVYVPFIALELRFSPQFHAWVYGYHQHSWLQVMRDGSYRPMVFMHHGLAVALFMATCVVLALGMSKAKEKLFGRGAFLFAALMMVVLGLSHSLGAAVLAVVGAFAVQFFSARFQLRMAVLLGALVMAYPMLRAYDMVPTKALVDFTRKSISDDRAGSIEFRFYNEDIVLKRALERPLFGWGGFDRMFIFDEESGDEASVLDGAWIITYARSGVFGFVSKFGLLTWPLWLALKRMRRVPVKADQALLAALAVAAAIVAFDLLPNGMFTYFPHLLAGALLGATRQLSRRDVAAPVAVVSQPRKPPRPLHTAATVRLDG